MMPGEHTNDDSSLRQETKKLGKGVVAKLISKGVCKTGAKVFNLKVNGGLQPVVNEADKMLYFKSKGERVAAKLSQADDTIDSVEMSAEFAESSTPMMAVLETPFEFVEGLSNLAENPASAIIPASIPLYLNAREAAKASTSSLKMAVQQIESPLGRQLGSAYAKAMSSEAAMVAGVGARFVFNAAGFAMFAQDLGLSSEAFKTLSPTGLAMLTIPIIRPGIIAATATVSIAKQAGLVIELAGKEYETLLKSIPRTQAEDMLYRAQMGRSPEDMAKDIQLVGKIVHWVSEQVLEAGRTVKEVGDAILSSILHEWGMQVFDPFEPGQSPTMLSVFSPQEQPKVAEMLSMQQYRTQLIDVMRAHEDSSLNTLTDIQDYLAEGYVLEHAAEQLTGVQMFNNGIEQALHRKLSERFGEMPDLGLSAALRSKKPTSELLKIIADEHAEQSMRRTAATLMAEQYAQQVNGIHQVAKHAHDYFDVPADNQLIIETLSRQSCESHQRLASLIENDELIDLNSIAIQLEAEREIFTAQLQGIQETLGQLEAKQDVLLRGHFQDLWQRAKKDYTQIEQQQFKGELKSVENTLSGVATFIALSGGGKLAKQVITFGNCGINMADSFHKLSNAASMTTLATAGAMFGLIGAIGGIAMLFMEEEDDSEWMEQFMQVAFQLSEQVEEVRVQMHECFGWLKDSLNKNQLMQLNEFASLHKQERVSFGIIRRQLKGTREEVQVTQKNIMDTMAQLKSLSDNMTVSEMQKLMSELTGLLVGINQGEIQDYEKIVRELFKCSTISSAKPPCQPESLMAMNEFVDSQENYNVFINAIAKLAGKSGDRYPATYPLMLGAIATLQIDLKKFSDQPKSEAEKIPEGAMSRWKSFLNLITQQIKLRSQLRHPEVINGLLSKHQEAQKKLAQCLDVKINNFEKRRYVETMDAFQSENMRINGPLLQEYQRTVITPMTAGFFSGTKKAFGYGLKSGRVFWHYQSVNQGPWISDSEKTKYIKEIDSRVLKEKIVHKLLPDMTLPLHDYQSSQGEGKGDFNMPFLVPSDAMLPPLPVSNQWLLGKHPVLSMLAQAQMLGICKFQASYTVNEAAFKINIKCSLSNGAEFEPIEIQMPFDLKEKSKQEAVWDFWHDVNRPMGKESRLKGWGISIEGVKMVGWTPQYHDFDKIQALLDEGVSDREAIRRTARLYPWGTGNYHWCHYHVPSDWQDQVGAKTLLSQSDPSNLPEGWKITVNDAAMSSIQKEIQQGQVNFVKTCHQVLADTLTLGCQDEEGLAVAEFEKTYRQLYGALTLAYQDEISNPDSSLTQWLEQLYNIDKLKSQYLGSTQVIPPIQKFEAMRGHLEGLPGIVATLNQRYHTGENGLIHPGWHELGKLRVVFSELIGLFEPVMTPHQEAVDQSSQVKVLASMFVSMVKTLAASNIPKVLFKSMLGDLKKQTSMELNGASEATVDGLKSEINAAMERQKVPLTWKKDALEVLELESSSEASQHRKAPTL